MDIFKQQKASMVVINWITPFFLSRDFPISASSLIITENIQNRDNLTPQWTRCSPSCAQYMQWLDLVLHPVFLHTLQPAFHIVWSLRASPTPTFWHAVLTHFHVSMWCCFLEDKAWKLGVSFLSWLLIHEAISTKVNTKTAALPSTDLHIVCAAISNHLDA